MPRTESNPVELGTRAAPFRLSDGEGVSYALEDFADRKALLVVFLSNTCPFVLLIREHLAAFARSYQDRGLQVVGINANDAAAHPQEAQSLLSGQTGEGGYGFPYLKDETQDVARAYGAACTPDFFLFDQDRRLVYHGQYDDARPGNGRTVTGKDLQAAVDAVLSGVSPAGDQVPAIGCNIKWREDAAASPLLPVA
ncbi:thioredoxin family protein [Pseudochelatococcus sp. B33]